MLDESVRQFVNRRHETQMGFDNSFESELTSKDKIESFERKIRQSAQRNWIRFSILDEINSKF